MVIFDPIYIQERKWGEPSVVSNREYMRWDHEDTAKVVHS